MFYYRHSVNEVALNKFSRELHALYLAGGTKKIARFDFLEMHKIFDSDDHAWVYFLIDTDAALKYPAKVRNKAPSEAVYGFAALCKIKDWVALEVEMLYVNPNFRKMGVAGILYGSVMKDGHIIVSGNRQNLKSRALWLKMVNDTKIITWAHDILDLSRYAPIVVDDDGELYCQLKIYEDIKKLRRVKRQDVRIIAYNPRYYKK
jgi:hypothetical protein